MIYEPEPAEPYEWVEFLRPQDLRRARHLPEWTGSLEPIPVRCYDGLRADFPWVLSQVLVIRERALELMWDLLFEDTERIPLVDRGERLFMLRCLHVLDVVDDTRSDIVSDEEGPLYYRSYAIRDAGIDPVIFTVPGKGSPTFVTDGFVERATTCGLKGLDFRACVPQNSSDRPTSGPWSGTAPSS